MMRPKTTALLVSLVPLLLVCRPAQGAPIVLDQSYLPYATVAAQARSIDYWGQAFTVGLTGLLDRVELAIARTPDIAEDMDFHLFRIVDGIADFPSLADVIVANAAIPVGGGQVHQITPTELLPIDLSGFAIQVHAGDLLGMVVHSAVPPLGSGQINWLGGCNNNTVVTCGNTGTSDGYTRGFPVALRSLSDTPIFVRTDADFGFQTHVAQTVPEPSSLLFGLGAAAVTAVAVRRRRKRGRR
jgi:hypothetical protein